MVDLLTLGLRVDASGALVPIERTQRAFLNLGQSATSVEGRVKTLATNSAFALANFAQSGTKDITSVLKSLSNFGYAFGPIVGSITLGSVALMEMFSDVKDASKDMTDSVLKDFGRFRTFSAGSLKSLASSLEAERKALDAVMANAGKPIGGVRVDSQGNVLPQALGPEPTEWQMKRSAELSPLIQAVNNALRDMVTSVREAAERAVFREVLYGIPFGLTPSSAPGRRLEPTFGPLAAGSMPGAPVMPWMGPSANAMQRNQALGSAGMWATQFMGPMGGASSGVLGGILDNNPWGAAISGITGVVSGLLSMGKAARESAQAFQDWVTRQKVAAGWMTQGEADSAASHRDFEKARGIDRAKLMNVGQQFGFGSDMYKRYLENVYNPAMDAWNKLEDAVGKNTDAVNRSTSLMNAPSGFYVEKYERLIGAGRSRTSSGGWETGWNGTIGSVSTGGRGRGTVTLTGDIHVSVNGNRSGREMRDELVASLRELAMTTGGSGLSLSEALDRAS